MIERRLKFTAILTTLGLLLSACGGGGGGGSSVPSTPTPAPTSTPGNTAFSCPSSATTFSVAPSGSASTMEVRRAFSGARKQPAAPTMYAVAYRTNATSVDRLIQNRAATLGAHTPGALDFDRIGQTVRVVSVGSADPQTVKAQLQSVPGVVSVSEVHRVSPLTKGPTFTNDPYFDGTSGTTPLYQQTATTSGQWDMHIVGLENAFSYSEGSTNVKLAIIDTGEDVTHTELKDATIVRTECFITNSAGTAQSTGTFVTDPDGHGTDVTGIAAAAIGNGYGFVGDAGRVGLMLYRVFPTPDDSCSNPGSTNPQCETSTLDIASAINDAVANGANVISMSLGADGTTCSNGNDPDTTEGAAVANAIAHNVIVVAATGNSSSSTVDPPACDTGVIAAGASAYNDGKPNGSSFTSTTRTEYVPSSYSNYGSVNTLHSASSWGIVAPGGDGSASDNDSLHWIENIWTTTPFDSSFAGQCSTDPFGGANDCRILVSGTSMSTPHVAGAAALILSVNTAYQSPSAMKQLLCANAHDIGDAHQGCGRLNVYRAMATAAGDPILPPL